MLKVNGTIIPQQNFRDNTLKMFVNPNTVIPHSFTLTISWFYENDAELFALQCLVDHVKKYRGSKFSEIDLELPYVPHARMDRVKNPEDVFTLKTFCNIINQMGFDHVIIFDPHSDVTPALLNNVEYFNYKIFHESALTYCGDRNEMVYCFPDAGAAKRYSTNEPYTYAIKKRNWETHEIESLVLADPTVVKDKDVIVVDDICSFGGTFVRAAQALKDAGAKNIFVIVSHCEKNIFLGDIFKNDNIKRVITSNSLIHHGDIPEEIVKDARMAIVNLF